ncbi:MULTISPECIES: hypothetical protein [Pseudomonas]|jgi:hypothetical protein|uniref:Uncharacterized protein n=1 Tax=Pseudomonas mosselii TaxID=78327 RepID=A0A5R8YUW9_9PSED|nr:hypothetical protein [Pseudomonas mosselii]TLP57279.1 hypothetical protein FEM01_16830 [Pseudomonas mosselii]
MTELATQSPTSPAAVFFKPEAMAHLVRLVLTDRSAAATLIALWSNVGEGGTVRVTQAAIAHECDITLRRLSKDLAYLVDGAWIELVEVSFEPGGPLVCVVNKSILQMMKPEELA